MQSIEESHTLRAPGGSVRGEPDEVSELRRRCDHLLRLAGLAEALPSLLHEVKNPLAAVSTALEVLAEESSGSMQSDLRDILGELRRANEILRSFTVCSGTLQASALGAVDQAARRTCRLLDASAHERGVNLRLRSAPLPLLPVNLPCLTGLLFNLVHNALDASCAGQVVEVELGFEHQTLSLEVRDEGAGMSPEVLARCTELFFTTKERGSGIGLALCQRIADASGASLNIESEPGRGTTVQLRLPCPPSAGEEK